jgi:hypothetical protein
MLVTVGVSLSWKNKLALDFYKKQKIPKELTTILTVPYGIYTGNKIRSLSLEKASPFVILPGS